MSISHGVVASSWDKVRQLVEPNLAGPLQLMPGTSEIDDDYYTNIAEPYNLILNSAQSDIVVLQHDDLEITDPDWIPKLVRAFQDPDVAVVGVIGTPAMPNTLAWWNGGLVGHQDLIRGDVGALARPSGAAHCVDGSFIALSSWAIEYLRFDEGFNGFHGYDVDLGMHTYGLGKKVVVAPIRTRHHTSLGFRSPEVEASWHEADLYYRTKWGLG